MQLDIVEHYLIDYIYVAAQALLYTLSVTSLPTATGLRRR